MKSAARELLESAWAGVRAGVVEAVPRTERDRFEETVLDLLSSTPAGQPTAPWYAEPGGIRDPHETFLGIGVAAATRLATHAPTDPEFLASVVALPWFDPALLGSRAPLAARPAPLTWPAAMVLAMVPASGRRYDSTVEDGEIPYLRHLAALPPLLRAAVIIERHLAGEISRDLVRRPFAVRAFDKRQVATLAAGIPADLLPAAPPVAGAPPPPPPPPIGSPPEAIALLARDRFPRFGSYRMSVDGDPGYVVRARELVYVVRWDVPPEKIHRHEPPISVPGDRQAVAYREPGWIVDRAGRTVDAVDLWLSPVDSHIDSCRLYPLPPGWRLGMRPPIGDGLALDIGELIPPPARPRLAAVLDEVTRRYAGTLRTERWPDHLVAWRVARHAVWTLAGTGYDDAPVLGAALLTARGMAPGDTLVDEASGLWRSESGTIARAARAAEDEQYGAGVTRRVARLAGAPVAVRAVAIADARARASVETDLFGSTPQARRDELSALATVADDLPGLRETS
ncbi:hypothetical protein [Plantactinospora sp. GCM10030261]|uniref:hypothetical protein n=1 Tax=Plantactinospora sp. GCM10030261 TaxID=3273420 RepID=UPI00361B8B91